MSLEQLTKSEAIPLNDTLFKKLWIENEEEFNRLFLHTEICWISKGACLDWFSKQFESVLEGKNNYFCICGKQVLQQLYKRNLVHGEFSRFPNFSVEEKRDLLSALGRPIPTFKTNLIF